jgi:membrane-bound lytic murein transglycosylase B
MRCSLSKIPDRNLGSFSRLACLFALALLPWSPLGAGQPPSYENERARFTREMVEKHGFELDRVRAVLGRASYRQAVIDAMERPYEAKPWHRYRRIFLTPERIEGGVSFWRQNEETLARAADTFGVPPEIIVAILGVETTYGSYLGGYRAIDALTTLGFSYPKRAEFFRGELEQLLLLDREGQIEAPEAFGSYAGALGKPQFIPSSYRAFAVDFDGDGKRDLWSSNADAIGSVANYLLSHGWVRGGRIACRAGIPGTLPADIEVAEKNPAAPNVTVDDLRSVGVDCQESADGEAAATLVRLDGVEDEYWVALQNFYVITRYNHSNLYAMAAYQLSQAIRERFASGA